MSLKYTAHFAWDLSLGQIRTSHKEKTKSQRDILNLKQKAIRSLSVCVYVGPFFFNIIFLKLQMSSNLIGLKK